MSRIIIGLCTFLLLVAPAFGQTSPASSQTIAEANNLIRRVVHQASDRFVCEVIPSDDNNRDVFEVDARGGKIVLRGNNGVSLASAFNWYLKYYALCDYSQCGSQLKLPPKLPLPTRKIRINATVPYRYMYNYCTYGYTMPWWNWEQWEKEIDWMAMNGINLPFIVAGQEAVWVNTFTQYGYTEKEVREWLGSAAHLPWFFMQNMESFGGELPKEWVTGHIDLAKKIFQRVRALGMNVVLQSYYGIVPPHFDQKFQNANVLTQGLWAGGLKRQDMLSPTDPLFTSIATTFFKEQEKLYGKSGFYTADPFHEGGKTSGLDLSEIGRITYRTMKLNDPNSVWVKMCWQADNAELLSEIPSDSVMALDLWAESAPYWKNGAFNGKSWIWCLLHNFGGNTEQSSQLSHLATVFPKTLNDDSKGKLVGLGITPEGHYNSPVVYELFPEFAWRKDTVDLKSWVSQYIRRRYGAPSVNAQLAWDGILATVYNVSYNINRQTPDNSMIEARPLRNEKARTWSSTRQSYNTAELAKAVSKLLDAAPECASSDAYRYDLVDFTRQALGDLARPVYDNIKSSILSEDTATFRKSTGLFLELIHDMDKLLATRKEFLLGSWINDARQWGGNTKDKDLLEYQARLLITTWDDNPGSELNDYACKQWSGLLNNYYAKRWEIYFRAVSPSVSGKEPFNRELFLKDLADFEKNWVRKKNRYPSTPNGDAIDVAREMVLKYKPVMLTVYGVKSAF